MVQLPGILHLIDTLEVGGAERVAVNFANLLPRERYRPFLATTRHEGPLAVTVAPDVGRYRMDRVHRLDPRAFMRLRRFIGDQNIRLIHAHASGLFAGALAKLLSPGIKLVWHDHCGFADGHAPLPVYWLLAREVDAVIAVKQSLVEFAVRRLHVAATRAIRLPNFVVIPAAAPVIPPRPGVPGKRIVCLANLREQKDHPNLIRAMALVVRDEPTAHVLLAGAEGSPDYAAAVRDQIAALGLTANFSLLGLRTDTTALLNGCDVAVLSSRNEGFPMSLLEYGVAGLATVSTDVGECADILAGGEAGRLVPPEAPELLATALLELLRNPQLRRVLGERLRQRVRENYSADAVMQRVTALYDSLLGTP